jgi:molybdopterin converting factor small subunit
MAFNLEQEFRHVAETDLRNEVLGIVRPIQAAFDRLLEQHSGDPVAEIIPALRVVLAEQEITASEEEVQDWATDIAAGDRIVVVPKVEIEWGH